MTAKIMDGAAYAQELQNALKKTLLFLVPNSSLRPRLAVIRVGDDPASALYVKRKKEQAESVGIESYELHLPKEIPQEDLTARIQDLNSDARTHGILVQLPLPLSINPDKILRTIDPLKDVDGLHVENLGQLAAGGAPWLLPCTPQGCVKLLKRELGSLKGLKALVIGRSRIVGIPLALLLIREDCTVTVAHSHTENLAAECLQADILAAAIGKPNFIKGAWIKPGAVVVDVGINRKESAQGNNRVVGDVDFEGAKSRARAITPVPGGVGPLTIACLLINTVKAFCYQQGIPWPNLEHA